MSRTKAMVAEEEVDPGVEEVERLTAGRGGEGGGEGVFLTLPNNLFLTGAGTAVVELVGTPPPVLELLFDAVEEGTTPSSEMIRAEQPNIPFQVAAIAIPTAHLSVSVFASNRVNNLEATSKMLVTS